MVAKVGGTFKFEGDWKNALKTLKLRDNTPFKFDSIVGTYSYEYTLAGESVMSPRQQKILDKLNSTKAEVLKKNCIADVQKLIVGLEPEVDKIRKKAISSADKKKACGELAKKTTPKIQDLIKDTNEDFERMIDQNLKQFVKGKHHKKKRIKQIVKHSIKVPLSIAAIPLGIALSAFPFTAPIGLLALKNSILSIKQAVDYGENHRKGIQDLGRRIRKNMAILQPRADEYADYAERAAKGDKWARENLKILKAEIKKDEIIGYAFKQFLSVHRKTLSNLSDLVDKYRKKLNKHKYITISIGRRIDKLEDEIKKQDKNIGKRKISIASTPGDLARMGIKEKVIDECVSEMKKKNKKSEAAIIELKKNMVLIDGNVDKAVERFVDMEVEFESWVANLKYFKDQRPKTVAFWKKVIKGAAFTEALAELGVGGAGDLSGGNAVGGIGDGLSNLFTGQGYLADLGSGIQENWNDIMRAVKAAKRKVF